MSLVLQQVAVALLVVGCALFAAWRLASLRARLATLAALARLPGVGGSEWLARRRARLAASSGGCGGCAHNLKPDAASRNQTPGALRR
jgi:hypothetical protein